MAGGIDWFRWHHGSVSDQKFGLVAKKANATVAEVLSVWACLLEAASASDDRGNPGAPDFEAMDFGLGLEDGKARRVYERMSERGLLDSAGRIASWDKRQPKREREDSSAERTRAYRERLANSDATSSPVTPCDATQTQVTTRGEESREEKKKKPSVSARGTRLPNDWDPGPDGFAFASEQGLLNGRALTELAKFRDYWASKPGPTGSKADWHATWRNWVRKATERQGHEPGTKENWV